MPARHSVKKEGSRAIETTLAGRDYHLQDAFGSVVPPLYTSATFARSSDYELSGGYNYRRYASPNVDHAEALIRTIEGGADALLFASGMAAMSTFLDSLENGARVVAPRVMYHGGLDQLQRLHSLGRISLNFFDQTRSDLMTETIDSARPDVVWIESPCNPSWDIVDIRKVAGLAKQVGARLVVDSTVAPPCTTRALQFGADIVFHSATKYLNGHHDMTGGVLVTKSDDEFWQSLKQARKLAGNILSPFDAWLLIRGLRTLCLRFGYASQSALQIAGYLENHARIEKVLYPGLPTHPNHDVACKQMTNGFGAMLSILLKGQESEALALASSMRLFSPATSLGGVESLIEHRRTVEGPNSIVAPNLLRLSIGLEATSDLIADLDQALGHLA